ncbi:abfD [Symbiodinium pilosum]|uniref:AbfD protein n=1 Tax=Symbiodinium pilosum TaxID=2952 RepID=A0A812VMN1_SYMPI|nr:abfD [Symbiodinium pilosum]
MIYGEPLGSWRSGKNKSITTGWVNLVDEKDIPRLTPWEFQLAHIMRTSMAMEYAAKKKKEVPDLNLYYEMCQSLADAIGLIKKQYAFEFPQTPMEEVLPLQDALALQTRFREGSVAGAKFDLLWYLQNGAHLLAGSGFAKKHRTTVFKPFKIQELMIDAILQPGPQLVFGIAPPGTGKTAVVSHILNLFPVHTLVFCCPALPVVLSVGRISNTLGIPYAFCKGRRITPSYSCGRGLGTHVDMPAEPNKPAQTAVECLRYMVVKLNLERKKKRLAEKKRKRNLHDLKRFPRIFLMCDSASASWVLRQLDPNRTILVVDEPPMGSDVYPENPEDNPLACAMMQAMMTPMYKTILMSATLPRPSALPTLVNSFLDRFHIPAAEKDLHVRECMSTELDRGAVMCGPSGAVAFPHQNVSGFDELKKLCLRLPADPLVLKAYTERALARAMEKVQRLKALVGHVKAMDSTPDLEDLAQRAWPDNSGCGTTCGCSSSLSASATAAPAPSPETPLAALSWPRTNPVKQPEIVTAEDFIESLRGRNLKVILQGELISEFVDHPIVWPSVNAMAESYRLAQENPELGSAVGFSGYRMSRFLHICESADDLVLQSQMQRELGRRTGTCFQRCVGQDASNAMWSTTYDIDQKFGTNYHKRFQDFLKLAQSKNWVLGGAMTDVKGDRSLNPSQQEDPDLFVRVAERKPNGGIVLRGCKAHQTGNLNSHWMILMPGSKMDPADKDYAVSCAVPVDAPGITYVYGRQSCDLRAMEPGDIDQGNAKFGGQETMTIFEDVYVPPEYVFMDGEVDFTQILVERFTAYHRRRGLVY